MSASSAARRSRRAAKGAGIALVDRVSIDVGAIAKAARAGVSVVDLISLHVSEALGRIDAAGGDLEGHCVVTIGQHPDYPGALTIEAKVGTMKPTAAPE